MALVLDIVDLVLDLGLELQKQQPVRSVFDLLVEKRLFDSVDIFLTQRNIWLLDQLHHRAQTHRVEPLNRAQDGQFVKFETRIRQEQT